MKKKIALLVVTLVIYLPLSNVFGAQWDSQGVIPFPVIGGGIEEKAPKEELTSFEKQLKLQQEELERKQNELEEKAKLLEQKLEKQLYEEQMQAKKALGEKAVIIDALVPVIKAKDAAIQAQIKALIEVFKTSEDEATRNIGVYLAYVLR